MYYFIQLFHDSSRAMNRFIKNAHPTVHKGRLLLTLLFMLVTVVTTWADNVTLTSSTKSWTDGNTYVTNGDVTIADRITVTGNVTLILTDGYTLTAPNGIEVRVGNSLTIEGGTNGTGTLTIEKNGISRAGIGGGYKKVGIKKDPTQYGNITINGGIVNVKGGAQSAGIGGDSNSELTGNGTITINGGIVNATGGTGAAGIGGGNCSYGAKGGCGAIVINGGQVTATGGDDAPGIGPGKGAADTSGSLALGWTNTTDFIKVTGVKSNLNVVYGFSNRLESISFAYGKMFNISGGGEATIKDIKNLESVELIPKGSEQYQLSVATISGISASYDLTGSFLDIPFSVSDAEGNTLTLGTDYTATLGTTSQESTTIHITEGGKYTLTITGMGSYAGSKSVDFEVISIGFKKDANGVDYINMPKNGIDDANIPEGVSSFKVYDDGGAKAKYSNSYDGGLVLIAPEHHVLQLTGTVTAEVLGQNLCDYLMVYDGGSTSAPKIGDKYGSESGEDIGTLISSGKQMTLTFHSDVSGPNDGLDLTATLKRDIRSCDIANIDDQTYTGSAFEPAVVITYEGTALVKDVDYEVTYSNNTIVGTATITITGQGNYTGSKEATFTITPRLAGQYGAVYVYQDQNGQTALLDGTSVESVDIPSDNYITVNHVTSNRTFTPGKASTVMLPFNYECNGEEGGTFYKFVGVEKENNEWVATMQATGTDNNGTLIANTPYLFMPTATGMSFPNIDVSVTLSMEGGGNCVTADPGSHWTFKGTYKYMKWTDDTNDKDYNAERAAEIGRVYGFAGVQKDDIEVGDFVKVKSGAKIRPMTCYLLWSDTPNATRTRGASDEELPSRITVRLVSSVDPGNQGNDDNGQTTAIGTLDTETGEIDFSGWYDMSGHKLSGKPTQKGLYINNGKKVVIKN